MCERCEKATERVGEPMPPQREFVERALERAEITFETGALQHHIAVTPEVAHLADIAYQCMLEGLMEVMREEGIVWSKGWVVLLGATRWYEMGGPEPTPEVLFGGESHGGEAS